MLCFIDVRTIVSDLWLWTFEVYCYVQWTTLRVVRWLHLNPYLRFLTYRPLYHGPWDIHSVVDSIETERIRATYPIVNGYDDFKTVLDNTKWRHEDRPLLDKLIYAVRFDAIVSFPPLITSRPQTAVSDGRGLFRFSASMANPSQSPIISDDAFILGVTTHLGNKWLQHVGDLYIEDYSVELSGLNYTSGDPVPNPIVTYSVSSKTLKMVQIRVFGNGNGTYFPTDGAAWQFAKLHVIKSRFIYRTYISHAVGFHLHSHQICYASQLFLSQKHPIRRLLDAFTRYGTKANQERLHPTFGPTGSITRLIGLDLPSTKRLFDRAFKKTPLGSATGMLSQEQLLFVYPAQTLVLGLLRLTREFVQCYIDNFYSTETLERDPSVFAFCEYVKQNTFVPYELDVVSMLTSFICDVIIHSIVHNQEQQHGAYLYRDKMNTHLMDKPLSSELADQLLHEPIDPAGQFLAQYITHIVRYNLDEFGFDLYHYVPFPETIRYLDRIRLFTDGLKTTDYQIQNCAASIGI